METGTKTDGRLIIYKFSIVLASTGQNNALLPGYKQKQQEHPKLFKYSTERIVAVPNFVVLLVFRLDFKPN